MRVRRHARPRGTCTSGARRARSGVRSSRRSSSCRRRLQHRVPVGRRCGRCGRVARDGVPSADVHVHGGWRGLDAEVGQVLVPGETEEVGDVGQLPAGSLHLGVRVDETLDPFESIKFSALSAIVSCTKEKEAVRVSSELVLEDDETGRLWKGDEASQLSREGLGVLWSVPG
jgi:hypothetical protein